VLLLGGGALAAIAPTVMTGPIGQLIGYGIMGFGVVGLVLSLLGALGLLQRRLGDPELKDFTTGADVFNLVFFVIAFGTALANALLVDPEFSRVGLFAFNLVTLNMAAFPGEGLEQILPVASVLLMSTLVAYIPMTHMSHFIGKYFAYHAIRWNDAPNVQGGPEEARIQEVLGQKVTWAGPHIDAKGEKTWADLATEDFKK
jgi:nitrate reductase gamma subunit